MTWFLLSRTSAPLTLLFAALVTAAFAPAAAHAQPKPKKAKTADKDAPVIVQACRIQGRADRKIELQQQVELQRADVTITGERAVYDAIDATIEAEGGVRIQRGGDVFTGKSLKFNLESSQGNIVAPQYRLELNNGQGTAERIEFINDDEATVYAGTYSTCEGTKPDWYLKADTLRLDMGRNIGSASRTTLYFKGVPIIPGAPAISFPISGERKSGVLPPIVGTHSRGGIELALPYYFNIAPNRDLTLYPNIISKRGIQLGANARYLGETYSGETSIEYLPRDRQTGTARYAAASRHAHALTQSWSYGWDLNTASDDAYPGDFANSITSNSQRQLVREIRTDYTRPFWAVSARVQNYQVLQDPDAERDVSLRVVRPYDRLPQISFYSSRYDVAGFDWNMAAELTRFWHPDFVRGTRVVANPQLSYPILRPGYFITPKVSLHATRYQLEEPLPPQPVSLRGIVPPLPAAFGRALPTVSIDSGMTFERDSKLFGLPVTQTLEPRLFYVYTPYRDQRQFPNFDSAQASFNFAQIFSENRFVGNDRISDANQLTAALVSRFIEPNGAERMRLAVGQRFYFTPPRVELDASAPRLTQTHSDILVAASGRINERWSVDTNVQYNVGEKRIYTSNHGVQWQPGPKKVLNAEYRYLRGSFEQVTVSGQWPIATRWYAVGRISHSVPDRKT
ncbi:MAG TPA: LPS-assembly protein LptD, partial [Burkholderiaceae bacterium]